MKKNNRMGWEIRGLHFMDEWLTQFRGDGFSGLGPAIDARGIPMGTLIPTPPIRPVVGPSTGHIVELEFHFGW